MNSSAINSIQLFNHSSSGSGLQLLSVYEECRLSYPAYVFQFIVVAINFFMGYPANIMVLWLVARKEIDSSTSDVFFINLAIVDALYSLMMAVDALIDRYFPLNSVYFRPFMFGMKDSSPLFLACICLDRYVAVVHPIVFTSIKDNKTRVAISMLVWPYMIAYCYMRLWKGSLAEFIFPGLILTIFIIMVFCNISIMRSLRKSVLGKEKIIPMKKKAQRTVQISLAIIAFHYLPIAAFMPFTYFNLFKGCGVMLDIAFTIMHLSCSIEPLLCISKLKQLPCLNNLPCICCRSPSPEPHNVST